MSEEGTKPRHRTSWTQIGLVGIIASAVLAGAIWSQFTSSAPPMRVRLDPDNALRGEVRVNLDEPADMLTMTVREEGGEGFQVAVPTEGETSLDVPLLGLRADRGYTVTVNAEGSDPATRTFNTHALPLDFPPIEVTQRRDEPALTLFDASHTQPPNATNARHLGYLVAVDEVGEIVWYEALEQPLQDARMTERGTILFVNDEVGAKEISMNGDVLKEWSGATALEDVQEDKFGRAFVGEDAIPIETDQVHHEVTELESGNVLTLGREVREIEYPEQICPDEEFDGTYNVGADVILEIEPDGTTVRRYSLFDLVQPLADLERIIPDEFCSPYLEERYPGQDARDWTHANAVVLDEERNALLVSARHTDAIYAIRYEDDDNGPGGELLWTLGEGSDFELEGDGDWFFHQHAPQVDDGSILLYDNGNRRAGTSLDDPSRLPYSRAVRYELDEENMTAKQVWEHRFSTEDGVYAPYVGDADKTDDETVLIAHGGLTDPLAHSPGNPELLLWARLVEVTESTGDVVFDLQVRDPGEKDKWRIYRAERIDSLYPPEYKVKPLQ